MASRIPVGEPYPVTTTFYAPGSEAPLDADVPATGVTCTITHANGTVILAATMATHLGGTGQYQINVPAQTNPADMTLVWTGTFGGSARTQTDYLSAVGAFFAQLPEIRSLDGVGDTTAYPTSLLIDKREAAETLFEQATGRHWTPKYGRDVLDGDSTYRRAYQPIDQYQFTALSRRLQLGNENPRQLLAIYIDQNDGAGLVRQTDLTQFKLYPSGEIERLLTDPGWPRGVENVVIEYVYGEDQPPRDLKNAFLRYVRYLLLGTNSRIPDRATQIANEFGSTQLSQANGWLRPTGISEVDAVLARYGYRVPAIA